MKKLRRDTVESPPDKGGLRSANLKEKRLRYEKIFNLAEDGIVFHESIESASGGIFVEVNPSICRLLGYSRREMLSLTPGDIVTEKCRRCFPEEVAALRRGGTLRHEKTLVAKDGRRIPVEIVTRRFTWGGRVLIMSIIRDITGRKEAEEALREYRERLQLFIEHAPVALAIFDRQMRYIIASRRWLHDYGLEGRDLRGLSHYDVFPEIPERWREIHRRAIDGEVLRAEEDRFDRRDGSVQWLKWEVRPWYDKGGQAAGVIIFTEDVTERKRTEEALRTSEWRLKVAKESADLGIYDWDMMGKTAYWDERLREMWGLSPDEPIAYEKFIAGVYPDDVPRVEAIIKTYCDPSSGGRYHEEYRTVCPRTGAERWVAATGVVFFEAERPVRMIGTILDVTERRRAEEQLQYSQRLLAGAEALSHTGAWEWDVASNRWTFSEEWQAIHGCYKRTMRSAELLPLAHREDRRAVMRAMKKIRGGEEPYDVEYRIIRADDGRERFVHARGMTIRDEEGRVLKVYGFVQDITERKETEMQLRRALGLLEGIARGAEDQIAAEDNYFCYTYFNDSYQREFKRLWGIDLEMGMNMIDILAPWPEDQQKARDLWSKALSGQVIRLTAEFGPPGKRQVYDMQFNPIFDGEGNQIGAGHVMHNVTDRIRMQEALQQFNEMLERRVAKRTRQVEEKARQLRALAMELGQAEQRERKRLAQVLHDHIQQLIAAARMQLSWMEHSRDPAELQTAARDINAILEEAIKASRSLAVDLSPPVLHEAGLIAGLRWLASDMEKKNQFFVRLTADPKAEPGVEEVRTLLFECVRELLFNAVKHAGVTEAQVTLMRIDDRHIRLIVSDQGRGFDPDLLRKRRPDEATFGLFNIQERLAHIGGAMEIETAPGRGSRITLTVPAVEPEEPAEAPVGAIQRPEPAEKIRVRSKSAVSRVLIVDDHRIVREGLVNLLRFEPDIEVVGEAADGPQAIEMTDRLNPDVVIMDVNLGEMGGVEATRRIHEHHPEIRVVGLSMHIDPGVADAMHEAGAAEYLTKSGPVESLIAVVRAGR